MNWYIKVLKQYADFSGRARRKEYWIFTLFNILFMLILVILDGFLGAFDQANGIGPLTGLYLLVTIIPSIAVGVRRLHDINRTGWLMLISIIPLVSLVLLVLLALKGSSGTNDFGPDPLIEII